MNRPGRPLFMKTYGKQNRKLEAWISPDNRKQVFASTSSSDLSVAEPSSPKPPARRGRKRSTADGSRAMRPANTKTLSWTADGSRATLPAKTKALSRTADGSRATRPAKTKALSCLRETDSDEENVFIVPLPHTQPQQQSCNTARKPVLRCAGRKAQRVVSTSESDGETATSRQQNPKRPKHTTARAKTRTHPSPVLAPGRYVTHRKGAETAKHKAPKRKLSVLLAQLSLNSSDDFVQGGGRGGGVVQRAFPRHATQGRRRALASADSSLADLGNSGVTNSKGFLRDISLNESSDRSLGPCHRKPLFSSTPSSRSLPPPHLLHPSISPSTSGIISLSTTQEELDVPEDPLRPSLSASLTEPRPGLRQLSPLGQASRQPEVGNCEEPTRRGSTSLRSSSSRNGGSVIQDGVGDQLSLDLFSVVSCEQTGPDGAGEETESGSHFVSATVGQDWLVEVVKERCLTRCCVVRLERVDKPHGDTAYSSCIDHTRSHNSGGSVDHTRSVTSGRSIDHSEICDPSRDHTGSVNDGQSGDHILNTDQSDVQILPVNDGQSADRAGNSGRSLDWTVAISRTNEEPVSLEVRAKQRCLTTHCQLQLERLTVSRPHGETSLTVSRPHGETSLTVSRPHGETSLTVSRPHRETSLTVTRPHRETSLTVSRPHRETSLTVSRPHGETSLTVTRPHRETSLTVTQPHRETSLTVTQPHGETSLTVSQPHRETSLTVTQPHRETSLTVTQPHRETSLTVTQPHRETSLTVTQPHRETSLTVTQPHRETAYSSSLDHTRSDGDQCLKSDQSSDHNTRSDSGPADDHARSENVPKEKDSLVPKDNVPKRRKAGGILRESKRRSVSRERPTTSRKACVSGVSGNRWGRRDGAPNSRAAPPPGRAGDCSLTDLLSAQQTHKVSSLSDSIVLGTPVRSNRLHLSSLLVNLTPDTHSWSRLKAALSLHRKTKAFLTPKTLPLYLLSSPGVELRAELGDVSRSLFSTPLRTPLPRHLRSQILGTTPLSVYELDNDLSDGQKVYSECGQTGPLGFQDCLPAARMKLCRKIGEGTFGEVFSTTNTDGDTVALKIIPIEGCDQVNGEEQKTFGEILHEIIISKELSSLKEKQHNQTTGFIGLKDLHCVQGCYPPGLLKAWDSFNTQRGSENDRPDFFSEEQLFLILEFEFGGSDLENSNGQLASLMVAKSVLHQVTAALAVAEQELCFEHRDLHWGNVLVRSTKEKEGSFLLNGTNHSLETRGVTVRIIDYSLSRLEIDGLTVSCDISEDEELFQGQGDYQFDIYRLMRQENSNMWGAYQPHSNVLWLHYLCSKLLTMTYKGRGGRGLKQARVDLQRFHDNVLTFRSASDVLHNCGLFQ